VILDLDQTLIFSKFISSGISGFAIDVEEGGRTFRVYVDRRPGLDEFLQSLSGIASVYLFTAGSYEYTTEILRYLDPYGRIFKGVFTRRDCQRLGHSKYAKGFEKCGTDMSKTVIVDDDPAHLARYPRNGIVVRPYTGGFADKELSRVLRFVRKHVALHA
jgi:RNA polymerase II subunit A small phosphatase-like protein